MYQGIKAQWTAALRSGEYTQGPGLLHRIVSFFKAGGQVEEFHTFCCLGVLCDLAVKAGATAPALKDDEEFYYEDDSTTLPRSVREWAGLDVGDPRVRWITGERNASSESLSHLNDSGMPFEHIADLIDGLL